MSAQPEITVVIPTRDRPSLVGRAVASAFRQSVGSLEVVVVVDGPDDATETALAAIGDDRLRVVVGPTPVGGAEARNIGVRQARGRWVAFLDDDDEWLPSKLERQLEEIEAAGVHEPIGFCPIMVRDGSRTYAWRSRAPRPGEHVSDYLWVRRSLRAGEGTIGTSTIVAHRDLLLRVPFEPGLRRYQDADWLLRAVATGAELVYCPDRLSVWTAPDGLATSITAAHATEWRAALDWIRARRSLVTPRAYAAFVLVRVAAIAARSGEAGARSVLWRDARRNGQPTAVEVAFFVARWLVPGPVRVAARRRMAAVRPSGERP